MFSGLKTGKTYTVGRIQKHYSKKVLKLSSGYEFIFVRFNGTDVRDDMNLIFKPLNVEGTMTVANLKSIVEELYSSQADDASNGLSMKIWHKQNPNGVNGRTQLKNISKLK